MDLALSEDESSIDELFGTFFEKECPIARVRSAEPLGFDADLWQRYKDQNETAEICFVPLNPATRYQDSEFDIPAAEVSGGGSAAWGFDTRARSSSLAPSLPTRTFSSHVALALSSPTRATRTPSLAAPLRTGATWSSKVAAN